MKFHNVLDEIFGNRTKVKLLRAFFTYPEKEFTESELQRIAGIPQASVHRNVKSLLANGLLDRERIGKANLYSLNKEHILYALLQNIFENEKNLHSELKKSLKGSMESLSGIELALLFGSVVKGTERADSDIDIFIVCKADKSQVEAEMKNVIRVIINKFGNMVSPIIKNDTEMKDMKSSSIFKELKRGEVLFKREGFEW
jgi:predicted nucleotidyltransferase